MKALETHLDFVLKNPKSLKIRVNYLQWVRYTELAASAKQQGQGGNTHPRLPYRS